GGHLGQAKRRRPARQAHEPGYPGGVTHRGPGLVGEVHPDQDVAGEHLLLHLLPLAALDLGHLMHRDLDLEDVVLHVQGLGAALQVALDAVLVAGVGVHHVPVARQLPQLGGVDLDRIGLGLLGLGVRWLGLPWLGLLGLGLPGLRRLTGILGRGLLGLGSPGLLGLGLPSLGLLGLGLLGLGLLGLGLRRLTSVLGLYRPTGLRRLPGFRLSSLNLAGLS